MTNLAKQMVTVHILCHEGIISIFTNKHVIIIYRRFPIINTPEKNNTRIKLYKLLENI